MTKMFTEIRTNPASFDDRGCLVIGPYEKSPPQCPNGCPPNLCKGLTYNLLSTPISFQIPRRQRNGRHLLQGNLSARGLRGRRRRRLLRVHQITRRRLCPREVRISVSLNEQVTRLRQAHRAGNPLERLVKAESHLVKAEVVVWESGNDVLKFFKGFCAKE